MTEFVFDCDHVRVDVERTRGYYAVHDDLTERCSCAYCRNFHAALPHLPEEVEKFLLSLGLTLQKPAEIMEWYEEPDGRHWYTVLYHLVGELIETGADPIEIAPEVTVGFAKDSGPFLENFPEPFFQLFLDVHLPWLLNERDC